MTLTEILDAFVRVETGLEIAAPVATKVKRVYKLLAPNTPEVPCFMHQYRRVGSMRAVGSRESTFLVRVFLLIGPTLVEPHIKSELLAAFDEAVITAFDADVMLGSTSAFQRITDEQSEFQPTPIDWLGNGQSYIGCWWDYRVSAHTNVVFS